MKKYIKIPLETVTRFPAKDATGYLVIKNKFWPIDKDNNLFLTKRHDAICGTTRQTVSFYIERLKLPIKPSHYEGSGKRYYTMIKLPVVWLKKRSYVSKTELPI